MFSNVCVTSVRSLSDFSVLKLTLKCKSEVIPTIMSNSVSVSSFIHFQLLFDCLLQFVRFMFLHNSHYYRITVSFLREVDVISTEIVLLPRITNGNLFGMTTRFWMRWLQKKKEEGCTTKYIARQISRGRDRMHSLQWTKGQNYSVISHDLPTRKARINYYRLYCIRVPTSISFILYQQGSMNHSEQQYLLVIFYHNKMAYDFSSHR